MGALIDADLRASDAVASARISAASNRADAGTLVGSWTSRPIWGG